MYTQDTQRNLRFLAINCAHTVCNRSRCHCTSAKLAVVVKLAKSKSQKIAAVMGLQTGQLVDGSTLSWQVSNSKNKFSGSRADTVASYQKMLWWQRSGKWGGCGLVAIIQSSGLSLAEREGGEDKFLASLPLSQLLLLLMSNLTPCYPDIRNIYIHLNVGIIRSWEILFA